MLRNRRPPTLVTLAIVLLLPTLCGAQETWPRFRGDNGVGSSHTAGFPVTWSEADYAWNIEIPGKAHSSPIAWKDMLFVTSAVARDGRTSRQLHRLDADSGKIRWTRAISLDSSHLHQKNSWASGTPATDGQMVYVVFADEQRHVLAAFDLTGEEVWRQDLGEFTSQHGQGASPMLVGELVVLPCDQMGPSQVVAFNKTSGEIVWRTPRTSRKTSYATPMILRSGNQSQLICLSGAMGVTSLDPATGHMHWQSGELPLRTVASPVMAGGLVFASCGSGGRGALLIGVDPSPGLKQEERIKVRRETTLPYVPTPVEHNGLLFLWTDRGIVVCLDPASGREIWKERVGGNFSGSPICIDSRLYCISESGDVVVVAAREKFELLGKTSLGGPSYATPAVANGRLFLRTFTRLMCLKAKS